MSSALKNVIKKNKKSNPTHEPSKFYKPPVHEKTQTILQDDVKIELSQDFETHRASGNSSERLNDFDRMDPVRGLNSGVKHVCTWCWVPLIGWIESPVRMVWHLVLGLIFLLFSLLTVCLVYKIRRLAWINLKLSWWYFAVCNSKKRKYIILTKKREFYVVICQFLVVLQMAGHGIILSIIFHLVVLQLVVSQIRFVLFSSFIINLIFFIKGRSWELCFPLPSTEVDYPGECTTCQALTRSCCQCFSICFPCCRKCVPNEP